MKKDKCLIRDSSVKRWALKLFIHRLWQFYMKILVKYFAQNILPKRY